MVFNNNHNMDKAKVIVTGGAGFIGSHIVDALINDGQEVHVIDNFSAGQKQNLNPHAILHVLDIRDKEKLIPIFQGAMYVFHEAAFPQVEYSLQHPAETHDINATGALNILEASRIQKVKRVIFASSSAVYGDQENLPTKESSEIQPISPYGAQKYMGEMYCRLYSKVFDVETVCLRYFNVYGPRQSSSGAYASVISKFIELKKGNKPITITGDGEQTRDFVNVKDVVHANLLAMKSTKVGKGEAVNIGSGEKYSVNHIASIIGGVMEYIPSRIEPKSTQADISKAKELLNWTPTLKLETGLKELLGKII